MQSNTLLNLLIQSCLFALACAQPVSTQSHGNSWAYGTSGGVIGFIVLILDIIVFLEVLKSNRPPLHKVLWCVVVFLFPIIGLVVYYLFSNRASHTGSGSYEAIP